VIVDTGVIVAAFDSLDPDHAASYNCLANQDNVVIPSACLPEIDYWLSKRGLRQAQLELITNLEIDAWRAEPLPPWQTIKQLMNNRPELGFVDTTVHLAAKTKGELATLDRRTFGADFKIVP